MKKANEAKGGKESIGRGADAKYESAEMAQTSHGKKDLTRTIEKAIQGDRLAFECLYKRYIKEIIFHARNLLVTPEDAEDAAQETVLTLFHYLKNIKSPYAFKSYMLKTVYTVCSTRNHTPVLPTEQLDDHVDELIDTLELGPQGSLDKMSLHMAIQKVIAELPPKQRETLTLRYYDDLEYEEIAQLQNVSVTTVGSNLLRAKKTLKYLIERDGNIDLREEGITMPKMDETGISGTDVLEPTTADIKSDTLTIKGTATAPAIGLAVAQLIEGSVTQESADRVAKGIAAILASGGATAGAGAGIGAGVAFKAKILIATLSTVAIIGGAAIGFEIYRVTTSHSEIVSTSVEMQRTAAAEDEYDSNAYIQFLGGETLNYLEEKATEHINPTTAILIFDEGAALEWVIVDGFDTVLAQGTGDTIDTILKDLLPGNYTLNWTAVDGEGSKARISRDFIIG